MRILGLDVGTTSLGWSIVDTTENKILGMGSHIFPLGNNLIKGLEKSKNEERRIYRGARRLRMRYKLRRADLKNILHDMGMLPEDITSPLSTEVYFLRNKAVNEKVELKDLGKIFLHFNKRRGFLSNRKEKKGSEENNKELGVVKESILRLEKSIADGGFRTMGQYFYSLISANPTLNKNGIPEHPVERIRKCYTSRALYEKEFDVIWEKQQQYYPELLTGEKSNSKPTKADKENAYHKIKNCTIFYQRPLKSQKALVAKCRFEPQKTCIPKASFDFQEFRIWQTISNIRVSHQDRVREPLTLDEKLKLAILMMESKEVSLAKMKQALGMKAADFNLEDTKFKGNTTRFALMSALSAEIYNKIEQEYLACNGFEEQKCTRLYNTWHAIYFASDDEWLYEHLISKLSYTPLQAKALTAISFEPEYGSISLKAIQPILAHMKLGHDYTNACLCAGYNHSFDEDKDGKDRKLLTKITSLKNNELRNPVVQMAISETIRFTNYLAKSSFGLPDVIRVETTREAKKNKADRESMLRNNRETEQKREQYAEILRRYKPHWEIFPHSSIITKYELWLEMGVDEESLAKEGKEEKFINEFLRFARSVNPRDKEKYQLWLECNRISPYTGKIISLSRLFGPEIEIEHIIPYSRSLDNSFGNKTLCESEVNADKGNRTPYEYYNSRSAEEWTAFKRRIRHFNDSKQQKFLTTEVAKEFDAGSLRDTAYIATELVKKLKLVCQDVQMTHGGATSFLRRQWGLNGLLNKEGIEVKNRDDHRHHAIDALVVALTGRNVIKLLSDKSRFENGKLYNDHISAPWGAHGQFRREVEELVDGILVTYRNKKRLLVRRNNKIKGSTKAKSSLAVRGPMHEDTFFGQITVSDSFNEKFKKGTSAFVVRKPLSWFTKIEQLDMVVDAKVKEVLMERVLDYDRNIVKAFSDLDSHPIYMYSTKGAQVPIKKVRIYESAKELIQIKPNHNPKQFVNSGNNYMMAIYEDTVTSKRDYKIVTFYAAVQKAKNKEQIFASTYNGKELIHSFTHKDLFILYENHPDEIDWNDKKQLSQRLYRIVKFTNGRIYLAKHMLAKINVNKDPQPLKQWPLYKDFKGIKVKLDYLGQINKEI
jgi:CRISPR-associated endonuclease Csn1